MTRCGLVLVLITLSSLCACGGGEDHVPAAPRETDAAEHMGPVEQVGEAPRPSGMAPESAILSDIAKQLNENLAGLRGEAAQGYARKLLEKSLPEDLEARRSLLLSALQTGATTECWIALLALPDAGPWSDELFQAVLRRSEDEAPHVRAAALDAIRQSRAYEEAAIERMWRVVQSAGPDLRSALLYALGRTPQDVRRKSEMLAALESEYAPVRAAAAFSLSQLNLQSEAQPWPHDDVRRALTHALKDSDPQVRWWAVLAFPRMGSHAFPSLGKIADLLRDPSPRIQSAATSALLTGGEESVAALEARIATVTREDVEGVVYVLQRIRTPAALKALQQALSSEDDYVRVRAAMALMARKAEGFDAPALFATALHSSDAQVVLLALDGLGQAGPEATSYLDGIEPLVRHESKEVQRAAQVLVDMLKR